EGVEVREASDSRRSPRKSESETETEPEPVEVERSGDQDEIQRLIATTVSGLSRTAGDAVLASAPKRALIRKDPTFSEADYGFRAFGELLRHLESKHVIALSEGPAAGDPVVTLASNPNEAEAFELLVKVVKSIEEKNGSPQLSGLKNQVRKQSPGFSEKQFGFNGFLQV